MKLHIGSYIIGVATAPLWFYMARKPLMNHILIPFLADEDMDAPLYEMMLTRNDLKDKKKEDQDKGKP